MITIKLTTVLMVLLCAVVNINANENKPPFNNSNDPTTAFMSRQEMISHASEMNAELEIEINATVEKKILHLTKKRRSGIEVVLGRTATFFPVFEAYLKAYELPTELKYLSVVESSLELSAKSKVGAAGLWQFMPTTGRAYDLRIDDQVDERLDLYKSTEAAVRLLTDLHNMFGDWPLAIAAYNCGPTRVRKAINKRRSKDFWKIKRFLPKETQNYVVKFMAHTYVMSYYQFFDLRPAYPDYNLQFVKAFTIYGKKTIEDIARETGVHTSIIMKLNPAYKNGIVPENPYGNNFVLPAVGSRTKNGDAEFAILDSN